jgi:hypothetical protein
MSGFSDMGYRESRPNTVILIEGRESDKRELKHMCHAFLRVAVPNKGCPILALLGWDRTNANSLTC